METELELWKDLKNHLVEELTRTRELRNNLLNQPKAQMYANAKLEILESLNVFVHKSIQEGSLDMGRLKSEIKVVGEGKIEDLMFAKRGGIVEPAILEVAKTMKPGTFKEIDSEGISYAHFDGRVRSMIKNKVLDETYAPKKRGNKFFLVRYTEEQMSASKKES